MKTMKSLFALSTILLLSFSTSNLITPESWHKAGSHPNDYDMGADVQIFKSGNKSATIASKKSNIKGFGTLMQTCNAKDYIGHKIKFSGFMKSENVDNWAGFWMRIDGEDKYKPMAFDNMKDRPIKGSTDWNFYEIILEVPKGSTTLNFGALLSGTGQIWFDDLKIEIIEDNVPVTGETLNEFPENLGFED